MIYVLERSVFLLNIYYLDQKQKQVEVVFYITKTEIDSLC